MIKTLDEIYQEIMSENVAHNNAVAPHIQQGFNAAIPKGKNPFAFDEFDTDKLLNDLEELLAITDNWNLNNSPQLYQEMSSPSAESFHLKNWDEINREFSLTIQPQLQQRTTEEMISESTARYDGNGKSEQNNNSQRDLFPGLAIFNPPQVQVKRQSRLKRIWQSSVTGAIFYIFMGLIVLMTFLVNGVGNNGAPHDFFGYSGMLVLTGSMEPEIPRGSFVLTGNVDPNTLQIGDDITYLYTRDATITHRIVAIQENYHDGKRGFQTKGINNGLPDEETVIADNIVGKVIFQSKSLGLFFTFTQNNLILSILLIILPIVLFFVLRMVFSSKQKNEETGINRPAGQKANTGYC